MTLKKGRWIVKSKKFSTLMEINVDEIHAAGGDTFVKTRLLSGKTYWNTIDEFNDLYEPISEIEMNKSHQEPDDGFTIRFRGD